MILKGEHEQRLACLYKEAKEEQEIRWRLYGEAVHEEEDASQREDMVALNIARERVKIAREKYDEAKIMADACARRLADLALEAIGPGGNLPVPESNK